MDLLSLQVSLIAFVATLIRSTFGFGEALVAVPLLALCIPLEVAAPLAVLLSITVASVVVAQDWRQIQLRSAGWLVFATLLGIPVGLEVLTNTHQNLVRATLALLLMTFSGCSLAIRNPPRLERDSRSWLFGCGFVAGILGGAYGMNGPPLVIYGSLRRWSPPHFRATLQGYFLPASVIGMVGYWLAGLWVPRVNHYYLVSLPAMVPAIGLGRVFNHRLRGEIFIKYVHLGLVALGALLLVQALRGR